MSKCFENFSKTASLHHFRFLSEDTIRFFSRDQNLFRYVSNNPLNFRDPSGLIFGSLFRGLKAVLNAGEGELILGLTGAALGGALGALSPIPFGALAGGLIGSQIGAKIGASFDSPCAGQLNCDEGNVPQASEFLTTPLPPEAAEVAEAASGQGRNESGSQSSESGNQGGPCGDSSSGKSGNSGSAGNPSAGNQGSGQRSAINPFFASPFLGGQ